tara:strand:+ start:5780 stop:6112 length:333 start_codon:yes stop_codon:yes gene_type:complete
MALSIGAAAAVVAAGTAIGTGIDQRNTAKKGEKRSEQARQVASAADASARRDADADIAEAEADSPDVEEIVTDAKKKKSTKEMTTLGGAAYGTPASDVSLGNNPTLGPAT